MTPNDFIDDSDGDEITSISWPVGEFKNVTDDGGVQKKLLTPGDPDAGSPERGDDVTVHYTGTLTADGTAFDSSVDRGTPFTFPLGKNNVIKGWDEGVKTMRKGEKCVLRCSAAYAYGKLGSPPKIPPDASLDFEVELLSWRSKKDISPDGDGTVIKHVEEEGSGWDNPRPGDEVVFEARALTKAGTVWAETQGLRTATIPAEIDASVESSFLCRGVYIALQKMKVGERAKVVVKPPHYAPGSGDETSAALEVSVHLSEVHPVSDVVGSAPPGALRYKKLRKGEGYETPGEDSEVDMKYRVVSAGEGVAPGEWLSVTFRPDSIDGSPADKVPLGVAKQAEHMKRGEGGELIARAGSAYSAEGAVFELEMIEFRRDKNMWEMEAEEKLAAAEKAKEEGNAFFKEHRWQLAKSRYEKGIRLAGDESGGAGGPGAQYHDTDGTHPDFRTLARMCRLNLAACLLRLSDFRAAEAACTTVLDQDAENVKAFFRRAQAFAGQQEYESAARDLKRLLELDPSNQSAVQELKRVKEADRKLGQQQKGMYARMFK
ncbi:unnamed protein product [Pedinophyceae sp. YPF-701]|nr:unnamed protein product [Pedinophyceae sp. YPF-701]